MKTKLAWKTEERRVNELIPYKRNPRTMSEKQRNDLIRSLKRFNLVEIPAIDTDGKILAGHQRVMALQLMERGNELIEVRVPNRPLTNTEYKEYLLTSNRVHGDWDYDILSQFFEIDTLMVSGFDDNDLSVIFADSLETADDDFDVEEELKKIKEPKAKLGDIYALGPHKIICGDAQDPATVAKLVGRTKIDMVYCDPPYNIGLSYNSGMGGKATYGGTTNDNLPLAEYRTFLKKAMENAVAVANKDTHFFWWCDQKYIGLIQDLYTELGLNNQRVCLWIKGAANPVPAVAFNKGYEPCVYATRGKPFIAPVSLNFAEVLNKELGPSGNKLLDDITDYFDIWLAKRIAGQTYEHPTQKPITLHERPIKRCTKPGDSILDSYLGSGSTLLAADAMKRVCFGSEREPIFIELIIKRYEKATNRKAKKLN
jgi:DNA modification methylase